MTSLLTPPTTAPTGRPPGARRLAAYSVSGGVVAAALPLLLCCVVAVVGWFLADAASHGEPRDALRVGALGWLAAHLSGVQVRGVPVTGVPLLVTALSAWSVWRAAGWVGESVSGHGPDADRIADGERDWTVPGATLLFGAGYLAVVLGVLVLAGTPQTAPSAVRAVAWTVLLCAVVAGSAVAIGSGRASVWATRVPVPVRAATAVGGTLLRWYAVAAALLLLVALLVDLAAAANILSQLRTDPGDTVVVLLLSLTLLPNAVVWAGSYLVGPGFTVGAGTLVSPTAVVLGPLPLFPLLAALPGDGSVPPWAPVLLVLPPAIAGLAAWRALGRFRTTRYDVAALAAGGGGVLAGCVLAFAAAVAGGAVGPGRMSSVGPNGLDVLAHAVPAFAVGAVVGALLLVRRTRRAAEDGA